MRKTTRVPILFSVILLPALSGAQEAEASRPREPRDDVVAPGLSQQPDFGVVSYGVSVDTREKAGSPHYGGRLEVSQCHYRDLDGGSFDFQRVELDGR